MKIDLAERYAQRIAERCKSVNGLLATPLCDFEAVRIHQVWIFGSTVKGSQEPNDLDVMVRYNQVGRRRNWRQGKLDLQARRSWGYSRAICASKEMYKWLSKGMKHVSRHNYEAEKGLDLGVMVMIYPRNDFPAYMERLRASGVNTYERPDYKPC